MAYSFGVDETNATNPTAETDDRADEAFSEQELQAEREWDEQIARDLRAGRLDKLINQAKADFAAGLIFDVPGNGGRNSS